MCLVMQAVLAVLDGLLVVFTIQYIIRNRNKARGSTLLAMGVLGGLAGLHAVLMVIFL